MDKTSTPSTGLQDFLTQCSALCLGVLEANVEMAFSSSSHSMKLNFALASWVLLTAAGSLCVLLWKTRKG